MLLLFLYFGIILYIYIYIYIYIYVYLGSLSQVQGSKAGSPQMVPGAKTDFLGVPFSKTIFTCLEDVPGRLPRAFLTGFGFHERSSDLVKTMIPYSTSLKNQVFLVSAPKLPPDSTLAVFRSGLRESPRVFWRAFGRLLATLTGLPVNKTRFVNALEGVGAFS